jgi:hypothetical protein
MIRNYNLLSGCRDTRLKEHVRDLSVKPTASSSKMHSCWLASIVLFLSLFIGQNSFSQVAYSQAFNTNVAGWTGMTHFTGTTACGGSGGAVRFNLYSGATTNNFVSPLLGVSNGSVHTVAFDYKAANWSANTVGTANIGTILVQWGATATGPWTTVGTINSGNHVVSGSCANRNYTFTPPNGSNVFLRFSSTRAAGDYYLNFDNISLFGIANTPPSCATALVPADLATGVVRNPNLTWAAATGGTTSYDVYLGTSPSPSFVANVTGTSYSPALLAANTLHYWKVVPKNAAGDAIGCVEQSFTTGIGYLYCTPTYASGCLGDNIAAVSLNGLSDTGLTCTPAYEDRSLVQNAIPNLSQSANEIVTLTCGTDTNQFNAVWVDFNQNGTFEASEYFSTGTNAGASTPQNITIAVPAGALLGNTKMRIRGGGDSQTTSGQACGAATSGYGTARDYTVTIVGPPACISPTGLNATGVTLTDATLNWNCVSCTGTFRLEYNTTPATFGGVGNIVVDPATSGTLVTGLTAGTAYTFFVRQDCGGAGFSNVSSGSFSTQTPGESCDTAAELTVYPDLVSSVNTLLTTGVTADGPAGTCSNVTGNPNKRDRWVKFVAPSNGNKIRIVTSSGTLSDMVMQVWSACPATGTALGCSDDSVGLMPALEFCQNQYIGGETYYVQLWPYGDLAGNYNIIIHEEAACPIPPDNDDCAGVETIAVGLAGSCPTNAITGTTINATASAGVVKTTCDPFGTYLDVIYKFNSGTTSDINFAFTNLTGTNEFGIYDACGAVYLGVCGSGTYTNIFTGLTLNTDYYVIVWANTPALAGTFSICINSIAAPICVAAPLAPAIGATTVDSCSTTTLSWTGVPDAIAYDVYFDAGAGPATTLVSADQTAFIGTNTYTIPTLLAPATSYSWRVIGKNSSGPAVGCSDFTFTTLGAVAPGCVSAPTAPAEAATICTGSTILSWPAVAGATLYDVYVDGLLVSDNQAGLTFTTTLAAGAHTWQIIPSNCVGDATGCATFNFTSSTFVNPGDTFTNAIDLGVLTTPVSANGDTLAQNCWTNAFDTTTTPGSALARASNDVFYRIELTCAGTITAGLCTSSFDTYLHLLDSTGVPVTQDDDACLTPNGTGSLFTSAAQPAGVYYLVVEGFGTATGTYTLDVSTTPTAPCSSAVTLKLYIEGYYIGGGAMTTVADNQAGNPPTTTNVEIVTVELHDATTYALVDTATGILQTDGTVNVSFTSAPSGSFYVAVKARNAVQTWSAAPLTVGTTPLVYNFTDSANKAFGDNMIEIEPGTFAFYSGDINDGVTQDGNVDGTDYSLWEADNNDFAFGPFATDLNGDGNVDAGDYSIWEANNNNFIFANFPQ